jgi:EAL domain-containing protein (putative c-di-GMP-specific phosphodiesterase class I)
MNIRLPSARRAAAALDDPLSALAEHMRAGERDAPAGAPRPDRSTRRRLRAAAGRPEFPVHYQPIVDLGTGAVAAREALVRWQDTPDGPPRPPAAFLPLAEEMGVIVEIGRRILHRACRDAAGWDDGRGRAPAVHVNVSPVELVDPGFLSGVRHALDHSGLAADRLVLEVAATVTAHDPEPVAGALRKVHDLGVGIALDRVGSGPFSLESLRAWPLDWLKVGPPFVHELAPGATGRPFVAMLLQIADCLGLGVVAEGIETRAQMGALRALGAGHGQGYFLGLPAAAAGPAFPIDEIALRA